MQNFFCIITFLFRNVGSENFCKIKDKDKDKDEMWDP